MFYSTLTKPLHEPPLDTIADLLQAVATNSHFVVTQKHTAMLSRILSAPADDRVYSSIAKQMRTERTPMMDSFRQSVPMLEKSTRLLVITLQNQAFIRRYLYARRALHIGSETLEPVGLAWVLPKRSPLKEPFNKLLTRIHEMGFTKFWLMKHIHTKRTQMSYQFQSRTLSNYQHLREQLLSTKTMSFGELRSVFRIWAFSIACTAVFLKLKVLWYFWHKY